VIKVYGLLLDRHAGGAERRHHGRIALVGRQFGDRPVTGAFTPSSSTLLGFCENPAKTASGGGTGQELQVQA
jgi:hypothetical protein